MTKLMFVGGSKVCCSVSVKRWTEIQGNYMRNNVKDVLGVGLSEQEKFVFVENLEYC